MLPFLPLLFLAVAPTVYNELRATAILLEIGGASTPAIADVDTNPVAEEVITFPSLTPTQARSSSGRLYHPIGIAHPSPVVVIHGVHHLGMNEPRLMRFAHALASHGYLVLTPQVDELADYSITKNSAVVIGDSVHELVRRSGAPKVGLLGLSFAGGMALIAASDPAVGQQLSAVIAIGAHDDLRRVLDFYETDEARAPDGTVLHMKAHEYGSWSLPTTMPRISFRPPTSPRRASPCARCCTRTCRWPTPRPPSSARRDSSAWPSSSPMTPNRWTPISSAAWPPCSRSSTPPRRTSTSRACTSPCCCWPAQTTTWCLPRKPCGWRTTCPRACSRACSSRPPSATSSWTGAGWGDQWRLIQWIEQMLGLLDTSSAERD